MKLSSLYSNPSHNAMGNFSVYHSIESFSKFEFTSLSNSCNKARKITQILRYFGCRANVNPSSTLDAMYVFKWEFFLVHPVYLSRM